MLVDDPTRNSTNAPPLLFCDALDLLPHFQSEYGESLECNLLARVQGAKDFLDAPHLLHQVQAALVQQPPTEAQISAIRLKVVPVSLLKVVVVVVLQINARAFVGGYGRGEGHDGGEVVAAAQQIELDACEESEQAEGVEKRKGSCYRCSRQWHSR
jgi:hypothetical protein